MQTLIQDMLVWLATFFTVSLLLVIVVRWSLRRIRQQRKTQLKDIETRCRLTAGELALPPDWKASPETCDAVDFRWGQMLLWPLPLGIAAAGIMWSITGPRPLNWTGAGLGVSVASLTFAVLLAWLIGRRQTALPRHSRQVALALRCWAVRVAAGEECRTALDQTARQMRRIDPELARHFEAAAATKSSVDQTRTALNPLGSHLADRLPPIIDGQVNDAPAELRNLANKLDEFYLHQLLARTRMIENWLRYPLALCLVPALNLLVFSPAVTDLIEKFGKFSRPDSPQVQPLEPVLPAPEPSDQPEPTEQK